MDALRTLRMAGLMDGQVVEWVKRNIRWIDGWIDGRMGKAQYPLDIKPHSDGKKSGLH